MQKPARVLHLASFIGNIGDNAMHDGAYRTRAEDLSIPFQYERLEIREFIHWNTRQFDDGFIKQANASDAVIIGGDSLFQTWREDTPTGTYVDAPLDYFDLIDRPICFYGLGVDATRGISKTAMERCRLFLDQLVDRPNRLLSVRDDGSIDIIARHLGKSYAESIHVISDGGLFARPPHHEQPCIPAGCKQIIAVNLAGDMPDKRFSTASTNCDQEGFCQTVASKLTDLLHKHPGLGCVFVPHIHADLAIVSQTLALMDDRQRRTRVGIAPYLHGDAWSANFDLYSKADVVIAMRFHANLVPLGLGVPTIGLDTHHKIHGLYKALELQDRCFTVTDIEKAFDLAQKAFEEGCSGLTQRQTEAVSRKREDLRRFHRTMDHWLQSQL